MRGFWKWFHCLMSGHPMSVSHIETIYGELWVTRESCRCGRVGRMQWPGVAIKAFHDTYSEVPMEYQDLH